MNYSLLESRTFWTQVIQQTYNLLFPLLGVFPNVVWLTVTVNILGFILTTYFHVSGVRNAFAAARAPINPSQTS